MATMIKKHLARYIQFQGLILLLVFAITPHTFAEDPYQRIAGRIETSESGIPAMSGLGYSPAAGRFLVITAPGAGEIILLDEIGRLSGSVKTGTAIADPLNMAFNDKSNSLVFLDPDANELVEINLGANGSLKPSAETTTRFQIPQLDLRSAKGLAFNPETGELFILDAQGPRVIRIKPNPQYRFDGSLVEQDGRISIIALSSLQGMELRGIAFNPGDGHLFVIAPADQKLYELTGKGEVVTTRDLFSLQFKDTRGMVFAPSGDRTDAPSIQNLYILDRSWSSGKGGIVELTLTRPKHPDHSVITIEATLIQTILASEWSPPSPDPSGAAYIPSLNNLFITDGEVDEMNIYDGANFWQITLGGNQVQEYTTVPFSDEPTGVAYNPNNQHLYFTDDTGSRTVYEMNPGPDGLYFTSDDIITSFNTSAFGCTDPEGITYDTFEGHLFIADGSNREVFEVDPGPNGLFDGDDDIVTHFDTQSLGADDPEGVEFNPDNGNLYVLGSNDIVIETTRNGTYIQEIDLIFLNGHKPAGLAYAPTSINPLQKSLYIVYRGTDNDSDPNENDGKIYEISLGSVIPNLSIDDVQVLEGDNGTVNAVFTVSLSGTSEDVVTVNYATANGTATTADNDYVAKNGQVSFQPGETSKPVTIVVNGDEIDEDDETFFVNLSNAVNAPIGDDQGIGTIINDDGPELLTLTFQDGVNGYNGTRDTKLPSNTPGTNYGTATLLEVDGDPNDISSLLYWDLALIPSGSTVQSVDIQVDVNDGSPQSYELYELKRSWVEGEATWNEYATGQSWQTAGAVGSADRGSTVLGVFTGNSSGINTFSLNAAGVAVVQSWVDNPSSNHGIIIQDYNHSNGFDFFSRETATASDRPKLTVAFEAGLSIVVNAKAYLEGPWDTGTMHTTLKEGGLLPLDQPFNSSPWNYAGTETIGTIPAGVVDWVLIKLRTSPAASDEVAGRAAFIKSDGSIVDLDGSSAVTFSGLAEGDYYIVIYHRNHLALMSSAAQPLSGTSNLYNFTTSQGKAHGTDAMKELSPGVFGMFAGDGNADGGVDTADRDQYWHLQNGTPWEYLKLADYNLDGGIDAKDLNLYWRGNNGQSTQVP